MRVFATGATRDTDDGKAHHGGYWSALAIRRFGQYMLSHETEANGNKRDPGNWKKGIPEPVYYESLLRHVMEDLMAMKDGFPARETETTIEDALCAIIFNAQGMLHERLKSALEAAKPPAKKR